MEQTPRIRLRRTHGVVPALDAESMDAIKRVVAATTGVGGVVAYKLGLTAVLRLGLARAIGEVRSVTDLPIIYDHQKAGPDVPDMAGKFTALCREAGADGLILFPVAGPRAVAEFVGNTLKSGMLPIVGGDLPLPDYNIAGGGYIADDALSRIMEASLALGADHFVVPANDPGKVEQLATWLTARVASPPALFLPGIGALGGSISATFAVAGGCRLYAVIGRAIYGAADPAEAAKRFADEAAGFAS